MGICQSVENVTKSVTKSDALVEDVPVFIVPDSLVGPLRTLRDSIAAMKVFGTTCDQTLAILDGLIMPYHSTVADYERQDVESRAARLRNMLPRFANDPLALPECLCDHVVELLGRIDEELSISVMTEERGMVLAVQVIEVLPCFEGRAKASSTLIQDAENAFVEAQKLEAYVANIRARTEAFEAQERAAAEALVLARRDQEWQEEQRMWEQVERDVDAAAAEDAEYESNLRYNSAPRSKRPEPAHWTASRATKRAAKKAIREYTPPSVCYACDSDGDPLPSDGDWSSNDDNDDE